LDDGGKSNSPLPHSGDAVAARNTHAAESIAFALRLLKDYIDHSKLE